MVVANDGGRIYRTFLCRVMSGWKVRLREYFVSFHPHSALLVHALVNEFFGIL